jgi:hypothetical protein
MEGRQERVEPLDRAYDLSSLSSEVEAVARGDRSMQQCPRGALGDLHGARDLLEQILAGYRQVLGEEHPYTLTSVSSLASVHQALGDLDVAHTLHEQALASRRQVLGDDHPDTLQSMNNLAAIRQELGEL